MDAYDMAIRARILVANGSADEQTRAAVNALAGAVERLEERLYLLEENKRKVIPLRPDGDAA